MGAVGAVGAVGVRRLVTRVGQYLLVVVAAVSLNFALPHLAPGDPVEVLYRGDAGGLTAEQLDDVRADYGLDRSVPEQYVAYWQGVASGDLGTSVQHNRPVTRLLLERLPWTLLLVGTATVVAAGLAVWAGAVAARRPGGRTDVSLVTGLLVLDAMPGFWLAMVLVAVFAVGLGWFPSFGALVVGSGTSGLARVVEVARHVTLPVTTLVLATMGSTFLLTRGAMLEALEQPYVLLARAKGASERRVRYRHALRNALLPVSTTIALQFAVLLSGVVVVETVFAYPGLGRLVYDATVARDFPLLRGAFLLVVLGVVLVNLVADLLYPLLDPRVRGTPSGGHGGTGAAPAMTARGAP